jgi:serine/threonine protein kinase
MSAPAIAPATASSSSSSSASSTCVAPSPGPVRRLPHRQFKEEEFQFLQHLGSGTYGSVREARLVATEERVAVKGVHTLTNNSFSDPAADGVNSFLLREISFCSVLSPHPQIVSFLGTVPRPNGQYWLVFERLKSDLKSYLDDVQPMPNIRIVQQFTKEMLLGLAHCHARGIIHRDLKPANILLTHDLLHLKLADFGLARKLGGWSRFMSPHIVTLWYRAPELFSPVQENAVYTAAIDIWSAGCILAQLLIGRPLFVSRDGSDTAQFAAIHRVLPVSSEMYHEDFKITFQPPPHPRLPFDAYLLRLLPESSRLSPAHLSAINLVTQLVHPDPLRRLTAEQALGHPFLTTGWTEGVERPSSAPNLREMERMSTADCEMSPPRAASSTAAVSAAAATARPVPVTLASKKRPIDRMKSDGMVLRDDVMWPLLNACHLDSVSRVPAASPPPNEQTPDVPMSALPTPTTASDDLELLARSLAPIATDAATATLEAGASHDGDSPAKRQRSDQPTSDPPTEARCCW